jgi:hypothetical protein
MHFLKAARIRVKPFQVFLCSLASLEAQSPTQLTYSNCIRGCVSFEITVYHARSASNDYRHSFPVKTLAASEAQFYKRPWGL